MTRDPESFAYEQLRVLCEQGNAYQEIEALYKASLAQEEFHRRQAAVFYQALQKEASLFRLHMRHAFEQLKGER